LDEDDQPAAGVNVTMSGEGQPSVNMSTDDKGRFRFQVCEGQIHLNASGSHGEFVK